MMFRVLLKKIIFCTKPYLRDCSTNQYTAQLCSLCQCGFVLREEPTQTHSVAYV